MNSSLAPLLAKVLLGGLAALIAARPLVAGDDPGRLRLTSSGGSISFNFAAMLLLAAFAVWRLAFATTQPRRWLIVPFLIAGVGLTAFLSSRLGDRYARPGLFIAWEWITIAIIYYLARRLVATTEDNRGLLNVFLATAVSVAGLGTYQALHEPLGLPTFDVSVPGEPTSLAGDDEFYPELNKPATIKPGPRGTFDSPMTLLAFLSLAFPTTALIAYSHRRWLLIPALIIAAGIVAALSVRHSAPQWTISMPRWLGVGPGNDSRLFDDTPTGAWFLLYLRLGVVGFAFLLALSLYAASHLLRKRGRHDEATGANGPRWEFYLGGMVGLLLGFIWASGDVPVKAPAGEFFKLGSAAIVRAVLWFGAFALLETARRRPVWLWQSMVLGLSVAIVAGFFVEAPGLPTILVPLFILAALAANEHFREELLNDRPRSKPMRVVGIAGSLAIAIAFLVTAALPAWATASGVRQARMASRHFPERHRDYLRAKPGPDRATALTKSRNYLMANIIRPLTLALERDPRNAALWLEVARWRRPLWEYQLVAEPEEAMRVAEDTLRSADRARQLAPHHPGAKRNVFEALLLFRGNSKTLQPERIAALNSTIRQIAERQPEMEVPLRYRVVMMLLDRGDAVGVAEEISTLLRLNREHGALHGQLTPEQREEVIRRGMKTAKNPPKELLEEWTR